MTEHPRKVRLKGLDEERVEIESLALESFVSGLDGEAILPEDEEFEAARRIWNGMIDRHPGLIVRCAGAEDVVRAVRFAAEHRVLLAVRGGGHNVAGNAICDGGMVVDLSAMRGVEVDAPGRRARVEGGALLGDLDRATQAHGLAVPGGIVSTTGVAGLTLGGGFGWLSRKFGLTIDSLRAARVVGADGGLRTATAEENEDLFWAIRGGGGNFGVVTSFDFELRSVGPEVDCGLIVYPMDGGRETMQRHRDLVKEAPEELTAWTVLRLAPPLPFLPEHVHGKPVVVVPFLWLGGPEEGKRWIEALRRLGDPHGEHVGRLPFAEWQKGFDALNESGAGNYWKSHYLRDLPDDAIDTLLEFASRVPSPHSEIFLPNLRGAVTRIDHDASAYAHRDAPFVINIHGRWTDPEHQERVIGWTRDLFDSMRFFSTGGVYVNFLSEEGAGRVREAYDADTWSRLVRVKRRYDPGNLFRMNQNIPVE